MKIYKLAQNINGEEYLLENGMLYDDEAEDVFNMRELSKYKVPLLKTPQEANKFLEELEMKTGRTFGRVPDKDYMKELRYKDTRKEREEANALERAERDKQMQNGNFYPTNNR